MSRWFFFSVLVSLIPLGFELIKIETRIVDSTPPTINAGANPVPAPVESELQHLGDSLKSVLKGGELLLISVAIAAGAIGEVIGSERKRVTLKIITTGCCVVVLLVCCFWFVDISTSERDGAQLNFKLIAAGSMAMFALTFISSGACLVVSED